MSSTADAWGWTGSVDEFLAAPDAAILLALERHHDARLTPFVLSRLQREAWGATLLALRTSLAAVRSQRPTFGQSALTFEFELPGEAGRRPDAILVTPTGHIVVLEVKNQLRFATADMDQVMAYAKDLVEYHETSHGLKPHPVLAVLRADPEIEPTIRNGVLVESPIGDRLHGLETLLTDLLSTPHQQINPSSWVQGGYAPLPALIEAAIATFQGHPLPDIKAVQSTTIPEVLNWIRAETEAIEKERRHALILITGAPGTGKTMVGIQAVVDQASRRAPAVYLSGNGPLVAVLQDALDRLHQAKPSKSLIRGMIEFKRYVTRDSSKTLANFYVFDEGQRAWTEVTDYHGNEIELLIDVASRRDWGVVVGLIGQGQDIWKKEQGSLEDWIASAARATRHGRPWTVFYPGGYASRGTDGVRLVEMPILKLDRSLRSRRVSNLHTWVNHVLADSADSSAARAAAESIRDAGFPIYVTSDRQAAEDYVRARYDGERKKYGWLASSIDNKNRDGLDVMQPKWPSEIKILYGPWFNADPADPASCCALTRACKEFGCQGLELDFTLIAWAHDLKHNGSAWHVDPKARKKSEKPREHTLNAYRVLLTRAREGMVILCHDPETRGWLEACGAVKLTPGSGLETPRRAG